MVREGVGESFASEKGKTTSQVSEIKNRSSLPKAGLVRLLDQVKDVPKEGCPSSQDLE